MGPRGRRLGQRRHREPRLCHGGHLHGEAHRHDDRGAQASDSALVAIAGSAAGTPWARGFGGAASDVGYGVAVDSSGNIVMTGRVESSVDFGGGVVCQPATVFVSKYSPTGATLWSKCLGGVRG